MTDKELVAIPAATKEQLKQFHPLDLLSDENLEKVREKSVVITYAKGDYLFKRKRPANLCYYLLKGRVELRKGDFDNQPMDAGPEAYYALDDKLAPNASIKALTDCVVLQLNRDFIDMVLAWSQSSDYNLMGIDTENKEKDWMERLLESPLVANIPPSNIHRLFALLEEIEFSAGEAVIKSGEPGDYFYIMQQGIAEVFTKPGGKPTFEFHPGDFFGEDALVTDAVRSATVQMKIDGVVGRLDRENFNKLFKEALVKYADDQQMNLAESGGDEHCELLDVRLAPEYRHGHRQNSRNIPVGSLRAKLNNLDHDKIYLVTEEGGRRSELATYMLRQYGFDAYLLREHLEEKHAAGG